MARFMLTRRALKDLNEIGRYSQKQWGPRQRSTYLREIAKRCEWLARTPKLGRHRPDIDETYYSFPEGQHVIFYQIFKNHISIIGIVHNRMDIPSNLN